MAKSLRAKSKQANRRKKRQDEHSHYAAVSAARLQAVSDRLLGKDKAGKKGEGDEEEEEEEEEEVEEVEMDGEGNDEKAGKKISTSGPRENRRESWRASKGLDPRPKSKGQNKQLKATGRNKAGRPKRRR